MQPFTLIETKDNQQTINALVQSPAAKIIGGGTNLLDLMKMYVETPQQLVNINGLSLKKIEALHDGSMRIGALVRNSDLAYDAVISKRYPVLSQALLSGASAQLRNMATVGGNLMQRPRCPYFYNASFAACNKRVPGSGCSAIAGYNRNNAILGTSEKCIATHPSDMCVALAALDAVVHVQGAKGERAIPINEFYITPHDTPERETVLAHDELITAVTIPPVPFAANSCYLKVRDRASYEFALTSAAAAMDVREGTIRSVRLALGGVGTKPWRALKAEQVLTGAKKSDALYRSAAEAELAAAKGFKYNTFKIELAKRTIVRALQTIGGLS